MNISEPKLAALIIDFKNKYGRLPKLQHKKDCANPECGRRFRPARKNQRFCGLLECKDEAQRGYSRKYYREKGFERRRFVKLTSRGS